MTIMCIIAIIAVCNLSNNSNLQRFSTVLESFRRTDIKNYLLLTNYKRRIMDLDRLLDVEVLNYNFYELLNHIGRDELESRMLI